MSGAQSCGDSSQHAAVREAVAAFVRRHGRKRGLHLAAQAIGLGAGATRNAYEGRHIAADAERAHRADLARLELIEPQIAALRDEAREIQNRGLDVGILGTPLDGGSGDMRRHGAAMLCAREAVGR